MSARATCSVCGNEHPWTAEFFEKDASKKTGLSRRCRKCASAKSGRYRRTHREAHRVASKRWCEQHPEARRDSVRQYNQSNKHRESRRAYQQRNTSKLNEQNRRYKRKELGKYRSIATIAGHRYRARKRGLPADLSIDEWYACLSHWNGLSAVCGAREDITADHWVPLCNPTCPGTVAHNIVPLCRSCNRSKHARDAADWLVRRFGPTFARAKLAEVQAYFRLVCGQ